ncbi:GNAT family N-acetyltransferase [Pseudomonas sp. JS3066]|uniref:GNAT family N-acetyltransferase n=1 Tax=unclassified Pseudomonas TaxID=196821 RepID=UPI00129E552E|nr:MULTISPECIES: GNAT family N-acetyltransferase [unclassified Pseudomonas]MDH4652206.1 GNAT family N-acetyltransferase [Pseudomonas sp. BN606]MRK21887.1 GNAT family N-acetyltransferase [Pseudomonas sp. JG-B]WVK95718.1 GNAT family N-acetyltransferase [Pseudomonas sp. JS3066]
MSLQSCAHSHAAHAGDLVQDHWIETLEDGSHVLIRPLRPEDREREAEFIRDLSPETRHFRFLCAIREASSDLLDNLMEVDYQRKMAYVALVHRAGKLIEVGISRYAASNDQAQCECVVTIADGWQDLGLDKILMRHLIDAARDNGFKRMYSIDAATNVRMQRLARAMGFVCKRDPQDAAQLIHSLAL